MADFNRARPPQSFGATSILPDIVPNASIIFRHPGYPRPNILLRLSGFDSCSRGLHHETARVACALVADNRFDGYLSLTAQGEYLDLGPEDVLEAHEYFFIVPSRPYAIGDLFYVCTDRVSRLFSPLYINVLPS